MQPPNLTQNLILAQYAVKHVETIMSQGPGAFNRDESVIHRVLAERANANQPFPHTPEGPEPGPANWLEAQSRKFVDSPWVANQKALTAQRDELLGKVKDEKKAEIRKAREVQKEKLFHTIKHSDPVMHTLMMACEIEKTGLGNCGEQSMVAFKYLVTKSAPGLAIVQIKGGNHEFVVIGMDVTVPALTKGSLTFPPRWGHNAVVCDPWYHEWFEVGSLDWQPKMKRILGETLDIAPQSPYLNKANVASSDQLQSYARGMTKEWEFERHVWLPHGTPDLIEFASVNRNSVPLQQMRASHFKGHPL